MLWTVGFTFRTVKLPEHQTKTWPCVRSKPPQLQTIATPTRTSTGLSPICLEKHISNLQTPSVSLCMPLIASSWEVGTTPKMLLWFSLPPFKSWFRKLWKTSGISVTFHSWIPSRQFEGILPQSTAIILNESHNPFLNSQKLAGSGEL